MSAKRKAPDNLKSETLIFWDNVSAPLIEISGATTLTKDDMNLPENASDPDIFTNLDSYASTGKNVYMVTADKGTVMRRASVDYHGKIVVIFNSVKGAENQRKAINTLLNTQGFKMQNNLSERYLSISISQVDKNLSIDYTDRRGKSPKKKHKIVKNIF